MVKWPYDYINLPDDWRERDLRQRKVNVIPYDECNSIWEPGQNDPLPEDVICVGGELPHSPTCMVRSFS